MDHKKLLEQAHITCKERGARLTAVREQVFTLMAQHEGAIGAYDLLEKLKEIDPSAKPATIYRALDFLASQGFVHKIESINSFLLCHHFSDCHHPVQLLICDKCGSVEEIQSNDLDLAIRTLADQNGFQINRQVVEAHGNCQSCQ